MKPDLDDYEELNDEIDAPRGRAMSWVVLGLAVAGFASLAYYAYHSGNGTQGGDVLVVAADQGDIKTTPANPGGEEFPNKDKTIYDVIAPENAGAEKKVETLMPEPAQPVLENHAGDHEDDDVDAIATESAKAPAVAAAPAVAPAAPAAAAPVAATTTYVSKTVPTSAGEDAAMPAKAVGEPTFVNEKPAAAAKDAQKAEAKKPEPKKEAAKKTETKPAVKTAEKPASGGSYKVQLGAYASEAEAQAAWKKISGAHGAVLSGAPSIVQAEVNGKTYYRLRAGSFADAAGAKAVCAKLGAQACIPVK